MKEKRVTNGTISGYKHSLYTCSSKYTCVCLVLPSKGLYTRRGHATAIIPCVPSKLQIHSKNSNIISILSIGIVQSIQLSLL